MIDPGLSERTVLVTGANHGIGAATARAFAAQGAAVFCAWYRADRPYGEEELAAARAAGTGGDALYRARQQQPIEPLLDELRAAGGAAAALEADLADEANVGLLFDRCEQELGPVEVLVLNHTRCVLETLDPDGSRPNGARPVTAAGVDRHFAVNARAGALAIAEFARRHVARGGRDGRIVAVSTDAADRHAGNVSYAASKAALESYSRSAAEELGRHGINVNIVAPGPIQTGYITPEAERAIVAGTPLGRLGEPGDVADVIVFLASAQAGWVTGQRLYVGGGWRM